MMQNDVCDPCPSRTTPDEYGCLQYPPQKCQPLERPKPDQSIHWMNPLGQMHSARDKNRTRQQKGLRDRNSPTCTLSHNGYGDNCSQTSEPRSMLSAIIPCSALLCSDGFFCVRALAPLLACKCLQCCLCWPCGKPLSATVRHNDVATNQLRTNQSCL